MTRLAAFFVHLAISLVIFGVLAALVVYVWYPDFFFTADGGWQGLRIILAVDLVAGPLLTAVVYKAGKPSLRMDLTLIALFQAACLAGGTWVVYQERPLALVYSDGRFFSMSTKDYTEAGVDPAVLARLPGPWPKRVAMAMPEDPHRESDLRAEAFRSGRPLRTWHDYYVPLTPDRLDIDAEAAAPAELERLDRSTGHLGAWLARHGGALEDYAFFGFASRYHYAFLGVRRADGTIVGLLRTRGEL